MPPPGVAGQEGALVRGLLSEFRTFVLRGNMVDLAVGIVIGVAFAAVVQALVRDLLTPLIAAIVGRPDFSALTFRVNRSVFRYGDFLNAPRADHPQVPVLPDGHPRQGPPLRLLHHRARRRVTALCVASLPWGFRAYAAVWPSTKAATLAATGVKFWPWKSESSAQPWTPVSGPERTSMRLSAARVARYMARVSSTLA
jgi:Large-conductance mechanosensitive channel, MscL